jgi:hypothetical protein
MGVVKITGSRSANFYALPRNAAHLETDLVFYSDDQPRQQIYSDFKTLRIKPRHYLIRTHNGCGPSCHHQKNWTVESSDDGASWTEINRRENNSDVNYRLAVKTVAVSLSWSFPWIRLHQTDPNHRGDRYMRLSPSRSSAPVRLQETAQANRFLRHLQENGAGWKGA